MSEISYSLAVVNGDLAQSGGDLDIVYGVEKLKQDLQLWLSEQYGIDRFHPQLGSTLQDHIGGVINAHTQADIEAEVLRVLQNYQSVQFRGLRQNPRLYSLSELLFSIDNIVASLSFDTVIVNIQIRNAENEQSSLTVTQSV